MGTQCGTVVWPCDNERASVGHKLSSKFNIGGFWHVHHKTNYTGNILLIDITWLTVVVLEGDFLMYTLLFQNYHL